MNPISVSITISKRAVSVILTLALAMAGIAAALLLVRGAVAQVPPDRAGQQGRGGAAAELTTFGCYESKRLVVRTSDTVFFTSSSAFAPIPNARLNMVVPAGTDCLVVDFQGDFVAYDAMALEATCEIRALLNGVAMSPGPGGVQVVTVDSTTSEKGRSAHRWSRQINVASQTTFLAQIEIRPGSNETCQVQSWQLEVDRRE
jgi:hypothetical protein